MRSLRHSVLTAYLTLAALSSAPAQAIPHPLLGLISHTEYTYGKHESPVIVFDIDDTLLDTRFRTVRIFNELASVPEFRLAYPEEARRLTTIWAPQVLYSTEGTLQRAGITNAAAIAAIVTYWRERFFSDFYSSEDIQLPDASRYVNQLYRSGAIIVYLTGRPRETMEIGTRNALSRWRFPSGPRTALLMKPDAKMDDLIFKRNALEEIALMGNVIGAFENEPANLNLLGARFPEAELFFLDTIHSPRPDLPTEKSVWINRY